MVSIKCTTKVLTFSSALFKHFSVKCRMSFGGDVCDESLVEAVNSLFMTQAERRLNQHYSMAHTTDYIDESDSKSNIT